MTIPIAVQAALDHSEQEFASLMRDLGMNREQLNLLGSEIRKTTSNTRSCSPDLVSGGSLAAGKRASRV